MSATQTVTIPHWPFTHDDDMGDGDGAWMGYVVIGHIHPAVMMQRVFDEAMTDEIEETLGLSNRDDLIADACEEDGDACLWMTRAEVVKAMEKYVHHLHCRLEPWSDMCGHHYDTPEDVEEYGICTDACAKQYALHDAPQEGTVPVTYFNWLQAQTDESLL